MLLEYHPILNMKSALKFIVVGAIASVIAFQPASAQLKIAYVNSQQIMEEAPGRAEAEAAFDKEMGKARAELQGLEDALRKDMEAFDKDLPTLDSTTAEKRAEGLRTKQSDLQKRSQEVQMSMQKVEQDLARPLMEQISKVLDEIRVKNGYSFIFDVAGGSVIVSADTTLDVTDQVVARLKELGPPKAAPTSSSAAPAGPTASPAGVARKK